MQTVTLRGQDFITVHNALRELRHLADRMQQIMIKIEDVERIVQSFEQGLADAYEQDRSAFDRKCSYYSDIRDESKFRTVWSIYEVEDMYEAHPYTGATTLVYKDHWGDKPVSVEIQGNRWIDLWRAANTAILQSGDQHHIYIEIFNPSKEDAATLILHTGS